MIIYVAIGIPNERFCDSCPCCFMTNGWCAELQVHMARDVDARQVTRWLRPQVCIDASKETEKAVQAYHPPCTCEKCLGVKPLPEQACYVDGKRVPPGGLADAIAEAEEARK